MHKIVPLFFTLALAVGTSASAQEKAGSSVEDLRAQGYSVTSISPVFSQLVMLPMPKGFVIAFEKTSSGNQYIREAVLQGETTAKWSQMITLTGAKGLAANPNVTPRLLIERIAGGFKRDCPDSFFAKGIGTMKISGQDAFAALVSCGTTSAKEKQSETASLLAIKGTDDYYTVQWAERGTGSLQPIPPDDSKWAERFKILNPIRLCPIVPGEAAPYPSCVNQK